MSRRLPYRKFAQQVRRFDVDHLLTKVARTSAEIYRAENGLCPQRWDPKGHVRQFSLASVARTAIIECGRRRGPLVDREPINPELYRLCGESIEVDHPDLPDSEVLSSPGLTRVFARMLYQQALFQYSDFSNIARTIGLLIDHDPTVHGLPSAADWERVLGVPLLDFMTIAQQLATITSGNGGVLTADHVRSHRQFGWFVGAEADTVLQIIRTHLSAELPQLRDSGREREDPILKMWSHNPLLGTPMINDGDRGFRLPIVQYLMQKITPGGLFYTGVEHFGKRFADELGLSFERYVGRHLDLLTATGATVHPEITYKSGKNQKKTVDFLIVFDELVLLVEVKGFRPTEAVRMGDADGLAELVAKVQHARSQIDTSAALLGGRTPELMHIPADRPVRGLVITAEPVHHIDTFLYADMFAPNTIESATVSAHDLERITPILAKQHDTGTRILKALTFDDPTPPSLDRAVKGHSPERNPVSESLWARWEPHPYGNSLRITSTSPYSLWIPPRGSPHETNQLRP